MTKSLSEEFPDLGELEDELKILQKRVRDIGDTVTEDLLQDILQTAIKIADRLFGKGVSVSVISKIMKWVGLKPDMIKKVNDYITKQYLSVEPPYEVKSDDKGNIPYPDAPQTRSITTFENLSNDEPLFVISKETEKYLNNKESQILPRGQVKDTHSALRDLDRQDKGYTDDSKTTHDYGPLHKFATEQPKADCKLCRFNADGNCYFEKEGDECNWFEPVQVRPQPYNQDSEFRREQKGKKIVISVPHSQCPVGFDINSSSNDNHPCDTIAESLAKSLANKLESKGFEVVIILGSDIRSDVDLNRPEAEDTQYKDFMNNEMADADFLIDCHSYPADAERYQEWDIVVLDMPKEGYNTAKTLYELFKSKKANVGILKGYLRDEDVLSALEQGKDAVLIEHNEDTDVERLSEIESEVISEYLGSSTTSTEDISTGNAGALLAPVLPKKIRRAVEPASIKNEDITIPINKGDTLLGGKWQNVKTVVKKIGKDKHGPTINGKPLLRYRIPKESVDDGLWKPQNDIDLYIKPNANVKQVNPILAKLIKIYDAMNSGKIFARIPKEYKDKASSNEMTDEEMNSVIKQYEQGSYDESLKEAILQDRKVISPNVNWLEFWDFNDKFAVYDYRDGILYDTKMFEDSVEAENYYNWLASEKEKGTITEETHLDIGAHAQDTMSNPANMATPKGDMHYYDVKNKKPKAFMVGKTGEVGNMKVNFYDDGIECEAILAPEHPKRIKEKPDRCAACGGKDIDEHNVCLNCGFDNSDVETEDIKPSPSSGTNPDVGPDDYQQGVIDLHKDAGIGIPQDTHQPITRTDNPIKKKKLGTIGTEEWTPVTKPITVEEPEKKEISAPLSELDKISIYKYGKDYDRLNNIQKMAVDYEFQQKKEIIEPLPEEEADPKELAMGIIVELEHTNDREEAKKIALQHLRELPDYYTKLKKMEGEKESYKETAQSTWNSSTNDEKIAWSKKANVGWTYVCENWNDLPKDIQDKLFAIYYKGMNEKTKAKVEFTDDGISHEVVFK